MIKYCAFKGGGTLLVSYITCLQKLWPTGLFAGIEGYAGTSAGSIMSALLAVGYSPDDLYGILATFDFKQIEDSGGLISEIEGELSHRHGLYRGKWFENWIEGLIAAKLSMPKATFRDLKAAGRPDLSTVTTYLNEGDAVVCNFSSTPDAIISEAVRASMSIPVLFDLFSFTQGFNDGQVFSDGGEMLNYPINLFDGYPEDEVIGFYLHDASNVQPPVKITDFVCFVKAHFEALMNTSDSQLFNNEKWQRQTVIIDTKGQSATNFSLTTTDLSILEQSGVEAADKYLSR